MQMEKFKSPICFFHVLPESSSGGTKIMTFKMNLGDIFTSEETTTLDSSKVDADMNMADSLILP